MKNQFISDNSIRLNINRIKDHDKIAAIGKALSNAERLKILYNLQKKPMNLLSLSKELDLPVSSVYNHVSVLEEAGLIAVNYLPTKKGHMKMCNISILETNIEFFKRDTTNDAKKHVSYEMPIGLFTDCSIYAPCGMATESKLIHPVDNPKTFFSKERVDAQLLWFSFGHISYNFPNYFFKEHPYKQLRFEFEICSETYNYYNNWPSDITVLVNDVELLTFTSPGDFGGRRGKITPSFWSLNSTQFGLLKNVTVSDAGVFLDNAPVRSDITFDSLRLDKQDSIKFTLMIKEDAEHRGGINLFGKEFGDYPQAIIMTLS